MKLNKVRNFSKNLLFGVSSKIIGLVFPFIIRTVMVRVLGTEYLGISSLFSAILQALNLVELGMGSALVFNMYSAVSNDDKEKLSEYLMFYKKCYRIIGFFILVAGVALSPFLDKLIDGSYPEDINIYLVYFIYLANTVLTYWLFSYKNSIALAYQRTDIESKTMILTQTAMYAIQIGMLIGLRNYYYYIIWLPIATIVKNIIVSLLITREYPDIQENGNLSKDEIKDVFGNIKALFGHQIAFTVINSADSIILSALIGLNNLTIYNNYYYILSALTALLTIFFSSIQAGIGNSLIVDDEETVFITYKRFRFVTFVVIELSGIILYATYNPFMKLWMGENLMMGSKAVLMFVMGYYITQLRRTVTTYKNAAGLWKPDIIKPYVVILFDIALDLFLINKIGSIGAMISTILSMSLISIPWETVVLYKHIFHRSPKEHFIFIVRETICFLLGISIMHFCSGLIKSESYVGLLLLFLLSTFLGIIWCISTHFFYDEFRWTIIRAKSLLQNKQ